MTPAPSVSAASPVAEETVTFSGRLTTRYERPVQLQRRDGDRWVPVAEGSAAATGRFELRARMTAGTSYFRVYAPATDRGSAQVTAGRAVKVRAGEATLRVVPAAVGQSKAGRVGLIPFEASFAPARAGRPVLVQRRGKSGWQTVGGTTQDARGRAVVLVRRSPGRIPGNSWSRRSCAPAARIDR